jgi:predicted RNA-binding Zn ribbon-like protein
MVIRDAPPESRAGSLDLIGGELALDFANTSSGRGWPTHEDHLRGAGDVVDWARNAKVIKPEDARWLHGAIEADPRLAAQLLRRARALREDIYATGFELAAGRPAPQAHIDAITQAHAACLADARLTLVDGRYIWSWTVAKSPVAAVLGPVSLSALTTLAQADLSRVKQCQGEKCGWLFFDTTKNKSRRWCEMEVCGNRAKQKRHIAKARA